MSQGIVRNLLFIVLFFLTTTLLFAQNEYWYKTQLNTGVYGNCGPASVAMLVYYATDIDVTVQEVRKIIGFSNSKPLFLKGEGGIPVPQFDKKGKSVPDGATSIDDLTKALKHYEVDFLDYDVGRAFADEIDPLILMGYKILVLVNLGNIPAKANRGQGYGGHYIIISGVEDENYIVQDPFNGSNVKFNRKMITRAMTTTRMILVLKNPMDDRVIPLLPSSMHGRGP